MFDFWIKSSYKAIVSRFSESVSVFGSKSVKEHRFTSLTQGYSVYGSTLVRSRETWSEDKRHVVKEKGQIFTIGR